MASSSDQLLTSEGALKTALRRDRSILLVGMVVVAGLAWAHMIQMASEMGDLATIAGQPHCHSSGWSFWGIAMAFVMWSVMMLAMMLPVVSPWLLVLSETARRHRPEPSPLPKASLFLAGYLMVWVGYSVLATVVQWVLQAFAVLSAEWVGTSPLLGGSLLIAAGIFQWTPLRNACIKHCRSPLAYFLTSWREGSWGAVSMGFHHGLYCAGCCWALMALSFVFGVMNLFWMAGLTLFLVLEKATSLGRWMGRPAGLLLVCWGLWVLRGAYLS